MLAGASSAGARLPGIDRFGFCADVATQSGADGGRYLGLAQRPSAGEFISGAGMAVVHEHHRGGVGEVSQIEELSRVSTG
jgi:hypothetical protein